jgi:hypothetical protein
VLELLGLGKQDVLLEETLSMQLVRLLRGAMADHPVIVAAKQRPSQHRGEARRAEIQILAAPSSVAAGHPAIRVRLRIRNAGDAAWQTDPAATAPVRLGVHCSPQTRGCWTVTSTATISLARCMPGQSVDLDVSVPGARGAWPALLQVRPGRRRGHVVRTAGLGHARHAIEVTEPA